MVYNTGMSKRIRVLHIMSGAELAGTERALLMLVDGLDPARFEHAVALPERGPLEAEISRRNVTCEVVERGISGAGYHLRLAGLMLSLRPHIVHIHDSRLDALPARLMGAKVVTRKNLTRDPEHNALTANPALDRLAERLAHMTIVPSEFLRRYYLDRGLVDPHRIVTIYNGMDLAPFDAPPEREAVLNRLDLPDDALPVCCVGRLIPLKGLDDVINALPRILEHTPQARLVLVGDGPERDHLHTLAESLDVENAVVFAGVRRNVPRILRASSVFVHASHTEALSNAVLEAMAARCPVAASDIPGNAEVIVHENTGLLFPPRNPDAVAENVIRLLADTELCAQLTQNARALIEQKFRMETMAEATGKVYLDVLKH